MEQRRTLIITALVALVIIAIIIAAIWYLVSWIRSRQADDTTDLFPQATDSVPTPFVIDGELATPLPETGQPPANTKTYQGPGFSLIYPATWSILTCNNSQNFEFDPNGGQDQIGVNCERAVKPITVLVGAGDCVGQAVTKGSTPVVEQKSDSATGIDYKWCTTTTPTLEITHRVSSTQTHPAYSNQDYSGDIDQIITSLQF